jgi:hypothetical protein
LTKELKVNDICSIERIDGGLVLFEQVGNVANRLEVHGVPILQLFAGTILDAHELVKLESNLDVEHPWLQLALKELESWGA